MKTLDQGQRNDAWGRIDDLTYEFRQIAGRSKVGVFGPDTMVLMPEAVFRKLGGEKEAETRGYGFNYPGYEQVQVWKKPPAK